MPSAPLAGAMAKFQSPLFMYRKIVKKAIARPTYLYTAKDNLKGAFHIVTERPGFGNFALNRWYVKTKVHKVNRNKLDGLYECVLCGSCSGSCPMYWWNRELFLGPTVLLQSYRWLIEPLDKDYEKRLALYEHGPRLNMCHNIFNCTVTCPKYLNPALAIKEIKRLVTPAAKASMPVDEHQK